MRYSVKFTALAVLAAMGTATAVFAGDAPRQFGQVQGSEAVAREAVDARAVQLARAALEGQQVEELTREELVSLLVLMSLHRTQRQPS
jgi:hypothetical protein